MFPALSSISHFLFCDVWKRDLSVCLLFDCDCRVNKKSILAEYKRKDALDRIIKGFAEKIHDEGGFPGESKTAKKCQKDGIEKGIRGMMERWFLIQELRGVLYALFELLTGK